jgi:hypothetical protein
LRKSKLVRVNGKPNDTTLITSSFPLYSLDQKRYTPTDLKLVKNLIKTVEVLNNNCDCL